MKRVSIIIPVREINDYIKEAMPHLQSLDYNDYEILIFPDIPSELTFDNTRIIPSGKTGPAEKRDMALQYATGDFYAFIDDDAYPRRDWLKNAIPHFNDEDVGAVGGPAVTPENEELLRMASGKVYESYMCSGRHVYRYLPKKKMEVIDLPSVNLIVRADLFRRMGGFDSNYYPGEDTKFCSDMVEKFNKKLIYDPEVFVWHHRRKLFKEHLRQIKNYASYRGNSVRRLQKNSLEWSYFIPSGFVLGLIIGPIFAKLSIMMKCIYLFAIVLYVIVLIITSIKIRGKRMKLLSMAGIFTTHITYGVYFIRGFFNSSKQDVK